MMTFQVLKCCIPVNARVRVMYVGRSSGYSNDNASLRIVSGVFSFQNVLRWLDEFKEKCLKWCQCFTKSTRIRVRVGARCTELREEQTR